METKKLRVLDLFSGIGMFSYGLHKTGLYHTEVFCDIDEVCREVLAKRFPSVGVIHSDIRTLSGYPSFVYHTYDNTPGYQLNVSREVDIIVGGFPCQDISSANLDKPKGLFGDKSSLWYEFLRLIQQIKPKGVIIENVSRLTSRGLDRVLYGLAKTGYDAEWCSIRASDFRAPHKRERVYILAYPSSIGWKDEVSLEQAYKERKVLRSWENLQDICDNPFERSCGLPQPLFRGGYDGNPRDVDRLKQVGNSIYWPTIEFLGYELYKRIT